MEGSISRRRWRQVMVLAVLAAFAGWFTAPAPALADVSDSDDRASEIADLDRQRQADLAEAQRAAALLEDARMEELTSSGMARVDAAALVEIEQRQAAEAIRQRIMRLQLDGMTLEEIAATTPGLVAVTSDDGIGVSSSGEDMTLQKASISFAMQCGCYTVSSGWSRNGYLEDGKDVVGIRLTKNVSNNMGGSIYYCSSSSSCNLVGYPPGLSWEDPAGVAHSFNTKGFSGGSHHGSISFSYKGNLGSVQPYTHYRHAWTTVSITGVNISTTGIGVSWTYNDNAWSKQTAGNFCGSC